MNKEHETRITIRFPSDLAEELKKLAKIEDRSINSEVVHAVRERIARKKGEQKHDEGV
jgi:metal-responsive CopG/Arc/MetJ family transcriptional regulator